MPADPTESIRREATNKINSVKGDREHLESKYGDVWDTKELQKDFLVESFLAPLVFVRRRDDGIKGSMMFQHDPRFYFNFQIYK